ncbi:MAG: hypothetical protein AB7U98_14880 [Candidatus Nitrosocosmicus sp.]
MRSIDLAKTHINFYILVAFIGIAVVLLAIINVWIFYYDKEFEYSFTFAGSETISINDGKIALVIYDNSGDNSQRISAYNLDNIVPITLTASNFYEKSSGKIIKNSEITFNDIPSSTILDFNQQNPNEFDVSLYTVSSPGIYNGYLFINNGQIFSIPFTLDLSPSLQKSLIWIVNGIAIAIAFWKIIKYVNKRYPVVINPRNNTYFRVWNSRPRSFRFFVESSRITLGSVAKNAILDMSSILFGIAIGLTTLMDSDYISGIRIFDPYTIIVLLGIGLGLGSLKEYVYLRSEPDKTK